MTIDRDRRALLVAGAALGLGACAPFRVPPAEPSPHAVPTIDLHSHGGRLIPGRSGDFARPFDPLAAPMRGGGMDVVCLAVVADTPVTRVDARSVHAVREPEPGELYAWALQAFARADALIEREHLTVITRAADLAVARERGGCAIVGSEGADFLDGRVDRVDEFFERHRLRQLQLVHYRVNDLGDIQTVPRVRDGLTPFGRDVVRRCNALGIVVDVAHAPYETVVGVVDVATRPLVLSHTSLSQRPSPTSRLISPAHARLVASTGGVIGIWPPASIFPTMDALARGIAAMADVAGVDHVGLGTDLLGLTGPAVFDGYARLPALRVALRRTGFADDEVAKLLGGNYARVFAVNVG